VAEAPSEGSSEIGNAITNWYELRDRSSLYILSASNIFDGLFESPLLTSVPAVCLGVVIASRTSCRERLRKVAKGCQYIQPRQYGEILGPWQLHCNSSVA
jgi:hypothetical protein